MQVGSRDVALDGNGFMTDPAQWDREVAEAIARDEGIEQMTESHWKVVEFIRAHWERTDLAPPVRVLCKETAVGVRDVYKLFRSGPAKGACRIAGLPRPDGCV
jgi:TusE/DsrC/DsvC family sulfur relay protein